MAEGYPEAVDPVLEQAPLVFDEHGSLPDEHMMSNYGMTSEEGRQHIELNQWKGTVAQMLSDPRCPVGETFRKAHAEEGVEGVQRAAEGLKLFAPEINIPVTIKTAEDYARVNARAPAPRQTQEAKAVPEPPETPAAANKAAVLPANEPAQPLQRDILERTAYINEHRPDPAQPAPKTEASNPRGEPEAIAPKDTPRKTLGVAVVRSQEKPPLRPNLRYSRPAEKQPKQIPHAHEYVVMEPVESDSPLAKVTVLEKPVSRRVARSQTRPLSRRPAHTPTVLIKVPEHKAEIKTDHAPLLPHISHEPVVDPDPEITAEPADPEAEEALSPFTEFGTGQEDEAVAAAPYSFLEGDQLFEVPEYLEIQKQKENLAATPDFAAILGMQMPDSPPNSEETAIYPELPAVCLEVTEKFQELDPEPAAVAGEMLATILTTIDKVIESRLNFDPAAPDYEQQLEAVCMELFEYLGIEYTPETVMEFIEGVMLTRQCSQAMTEVSRSTEIHDEGTHELKPYDKVNSGILTRLFEFPLPRTLGNLILRLSV